MPDYVKKTFNESVFKNNHGELLSLYHWTDEDFSSFSKGDIGFHFGTLNAAYKRYVEKTKLRGDIIKSYYKECYINVKNPAIIDFDPITWDAFTLSHKLYEQGIISKEDLLFFEVLDGYYKSKYDSPAASELQKMLFEKGYDGVIYTNSHEGDLSVIVFSPDQIYTVAENGVDIYNKNVPVAPLSGVRYSVTTPGGGATAAPSFVDPARKSVTLQSSNFKPSFKDRGSDSVVASQIAFTNAQAGLERLMREVGISQPEAEAMVQYTRIARAQANNIIGGKFVDISKSI